MLNLVNKIIILMVMPDRGGLLFRDCITCRLCVTKIKN